MAHKTPIMRTEIAETRRKSRCELCGEMKAGCVKHRHADSKESVVLCHSCSRREEAAPLLREAFGKAVEAHVKEYREKNGKSKRPSKGGGGRLKW